jgi:hypothetical protein
VKVVGGGGGGAIATGTAAALLAKERRGNCTFCLKNHNHEDCEGVKDPKTRKSLARTVNTVDVSLFM